MSGDGAKQSPPLDRILSGRFANEHEEDESAHAHVISVAVDYDHVKKKDYESAYGSVAKALESVLNQHLEKSVVAGEGGPPIGDLVTVAAQRHVSQPGARRVYPHDRPADDASDISEDCHSEVVHYDSTVVTFGVRRGSESNAHAQQGPWINFDQRDFETILIGEAIISGDRLECDTPTAPSRNLAMTRATLLKDDNVVSVQAVNGFFIKRRRIMWIFISLLVVICLIAVVLSRTVRTGPAPEAQVFAIHMPALLEKIVSSLPNYTQTTLRSELLSSSQNIDWYKDDLWSPNNAFQPVSSQGKAWKWLMSDPNLQSRDSRDVTYRFALATFYFATNGPGWRNNSNWLDPTKDICAWWHDAVTSYNERLGYYDFCKTAGFTALIIPDNNLVGTIPSELSLISSLTLVKLYSNSLRGTIPDDVWNSWNAVYALQLENNNFSGTLPAAIGAFSRLLYLFVQFNSFSGSLPTEIGAREGLRQLIVSNNRIEGKIPTELGRLRPSAGFIFDAAHNMLSGTIPTEIGDISKLRFFDVRDNRLHGRIPSQLGSCNNLYFIFTSNNFLSGPIPSELGRLAYLKSLALNDNSLTGTLPSQLGLLTGLTSFDVATNPIDGSLPTEMGQLLQLTSFRLSRTSVTGSIPRNLCSALSPQSGINEIVIDCDNVQCACNCTCE